MIHLIVSLQEESCEGEEIDEPHEEIVVVHEREYPKLHSILKQRSASVSSEDHFSVPCDHLSSGEEGDAEYGEDNTASCSLPSSFGSKKSVSFNDHVDQTVYRINQSVSTLHATLKNKRKKFKKKEQRHERLRQRRRSSGSFSCESCPDEEHNSPQGKFCI